MVDADGLTLLPAFIDPHVHLRTPGQEHEEDHRDGHGGRCGGRFLRTILAMPNTDPVVDSAAVLHSLHERAALEARRRASASSAPSRSASSASSSRELGELADAGAVGFSDDGRPVELSAALLRRALQYASTTGPRALAALRGLSP